jgi:NAD(P)-dependent dehydrogenase (short-subunit alcohol dehydrogenase family)
VELAPAGIIANAILAGVTDTNALRQIPGYEKIMEVTRQRNPNRRLTQPGDVRAASRPCAIRPPIGSLAIRCVWTAERTS